MDILVENKQNDVLIDPDQVKKVVQCVLALEKIHCDQISILFTTEEHISELHGIFFNDPTTTDCITFPIDSPGGSSPIFLGEVVICPKTALKYTKNNPKDPCVYQETTLYVVHGILHLLGYLDDPDHIDIMREKEQLHMRNIIENGAILKDLKK